jgi:hypothetical protein
LASLWGGICTEGTDPSTPDQGIERLDVMGWTSP